MRLRSRRAKSNSFLKRRKRCKPTAATGGGRMGNILVCDDERSICEMLDIALRRDGHKVETVKSGEDAKRKLEGNLYDVVVTDIKMPNTDGIEVLRYAHQVSPDSAVILITAVDDYEAAVKR
jgi:DNA-binding NtrC family response regulator